VTITLDPLAIRKSLGRKTWGVPIPFGPAGWQFDTTAPRAGRIIVTLGPPPFEDDDWLHASISRPTMPTYQDLTQLHEAVWGHGWAYQCFAPPSAHVNIHEHALHLYGRPDGQAVLPNFGALGSI
jgi:hypothetical protein